MLFPWREGVGQIALGRDRGARRTAPAMKGLIWRLRGGVLKANRVASHDAHIDMNDNVCRLNRSMQHMH